MRAIVASILTGFGLLPAQQRGREVSVAGQVVARGVVWGGETRCVAFDGDGSHALSAGEFGDLVYWDCEGARPLPVRRWPGFGGEIHDLALHPGDPWALIVLERDGMRRVVRQDLGPEEEPEEGPEQGRKQDRELFVGAIDAVAFSPDGSRWAMLRGSEERRRVVVYDAAMPAGPEPQALFERPAIAVDHVCFAPDGGAVYLARSDTTTRWPLDGAEPEDLPRRVLAIDAAGTERTGPAYEPRIGRWSASPDGAVLATEDDTMRGMAKRKHVLRRTPTEQRWSLGGAIVRLYASPRGSVWATDHRGTTHVVGPGAEDRAVVTAHVGRVASAVFSLDAKYLALLGRAGLRVISEQSAVVLDRVDVVAIVPGASGSEFVLVTAEGLERWHAASGRTVGEVVAFREGRPHVDAALAPVGFVPLGRGWLCAPGFVGGRTAELCAVSADGEVSRLDAGPGGSMRRHFFAPAIRPGEPVVFAASEPVDPRPIGNPLARLSAWSATGERVAQRRLEHDVFRLRRSPDGQRVGGLVYERQRAGFVWRFEEWDATTLEGVRTLELGESGSWFEYLDADRVLMGDVDIAWLLDLASGDRSPVTLTNEESTGVRRAFPLAISRDRRHLALVREAEVLWLRLR